MKQKPMTTREFITSGLRNMLPKFKKTWRKREDAYSIELVDLRIELSSPAPEFDANLKAYADELVKRFNAYNQLKDIVDQIANMDRFNSAEEPNGKKVDGTERWEISRPEDGEADSHEALMSMILLARKARKGL